MKGRRMIVKGPVICMAPSCRRGWLGQCKAEGAQHPRHSIGPLCSCTLYRRWYGPGAPPHTPASSRWISSSASATSTSALWQRCDSWRLNLCPGGRWKLSWSGTATMCISWCGPPGPGSPLGPMFAPISCTPASCRRAECPRPGAPRGRWSPRRTVLPVAVATGPSRGARTRGPRRRGWIGGMWITAVQITASPTLGCGGIRTPDTHGWRGAGALPPRLRKCAVPVRGLW